VNDVPAIPAQFDRRGEGSPKEGRMSGKTGLENRRTRTDWAERITTAWSDQIEDIFQTGNLIEAAKCELPHGEFLKMVKEELPFSRQVAHRLMAIATNDNIRNVDPGPHLPVAWTILYELTKLTDEQFDAAIASGMIHPKMTRKDAKALRGEPEAKPEVPPMTKCVSAVRRAVKGAMRELAPEEWEGLLRQLRTVIDEIDEQEVEIHGYHAERQSS
jgi:hypothetical protein